MNETGLTKTTKLVVIAVVVIVVAAGSLFAYTTMSSSGSNLGQSSTISSISFTNSSGQGGTNVSDVSLTGYQQGYTPYGSWANYLGYIPAGYKIAPKGPNSPTFPCPAGMTSTECATFQQTCGNGVCDPNETCQTCPIDCAITGQMVCDPYTGRSGSPASVCQVALQEQAAQNGGG